MSSTPHSPRKQGFLQGAAILTCGALLAKVIGALFKIPLTRFITTEGAGHFNVAYNIYIVLLNVSSTGLPVAVSRLISEANILGQRRQVQSIHRISLMLFLAIGLCCGGAMFFGAQAIADWMRDPDAVYAIAVLAPAALFVSVCSAFRGYFQGQQYMTPTAVAQVLEALSKLLIGLAAVWFVMNSGWDLPQAAGASISGVTAGSILGCTYFVFQYRKRRIRLTSEDRAEAIPSAAHTAGQIIRLAVPITIGATGLQIFNALAGRIILGRLQDVLGFTLSQASSHYGIYSMAQTLYMLPSALVQPLTVSMIPAITEALALKDPREAKQKAESAIRIAGLIAIPAGVGLSVLAAPIQRLLYGYDSETLAVAGPTMSILGIAAALYCFVLVTNAVLQANGKPALPIYATLAGGVTNLAVCYFLVGMPNVHIYGAALGTVAYCAVTVLVNLAMIRRTLDLPPRFMAQIGKTVLAAVVMGVTAWAVHTFLGNVILSIGAAGAVYAVAVILLKVLTHYDCMMLPKGELIARLLRIKQDS